MTGNACGESKLCADINLFLVPVLDTTFVASVFLSVRRIEWKINHILATKRDFVQSKRLHLSLNYYFVNDTEKKISTQIVDFVIIHLLVLVAMATKTRSFTHLLSQAHPASQHSARSGVCVCVCAITIATVRLLSSLLRICIKVFRAATTYADNEHKFGERIVIILSHSLKFCKETKMILAQPHILWGRHRTRIYRVDGT